MKKTICVVFSLVFIVVAFGNTAHAQNQVTLLWGMWGAPEEIAVHQKVADAYMAKNPNVKITLWTQAWGDYFTKLQTLLTANDPTTIPDVFFLSPVPSYAAKGVLKNLDPLIKSSGMDLSDYWPGAIQSTSYKGSVYGFPRDIGIEVLYYNKDDFDKAKLAYPTDKWTWDDLHKAAQALTIKHASGKISRYGLAMEGGKYFDWVLANGGLILDDMFNPTTCKLSDPKSVAGVDFFAGMMNDGIAWRDADLAQAGGDQAVFLADQASMFIQNASRIPALNAAKINYDIAAVPTAPGGGRSAGSANGAAWVMSNVTTKQDAAWAFMQFLQKPDGGQAIYFAAGDSFPPTKSGANSPVFMTKDHGPANKNAFLIGAATATNNGNGWFADWNDLNGTVINPVLANIWAGTAKADDVLPGLCDSVNKYLAAHGYTGAAATAAATKSS